MCGYSLDVQTEQPSMPASSSSSSICPYCPAPLPTFLLPSKPIALGLRGLITVTAP